MACVLTRKEIWKRRCRDNDTHKYTYDYIRRETMHRQQRFRSSSSSPSSLSSLPFWTSRLSVSTVSLLSTSSLTPTPTRTRTRTRTPTPTPISTLTPTPTPILTPTPTPIPIQAPALTLTSTSPLPSLSSASLSSSLSSSLLTSILPSPTSPWSTSNISPYSGSVQQTCPRLSVLANESPITSPVSIPCPRLASVLAWSVTLLLVSSCIGLTDAGILNGHPLGKRSFIDIQCKGIYDKSIFARLDRICEDCYNLFREPQLHQLCRKNCFTSDYFKGCLDVLLLQDEVEKIQTWIKQLHGAEPGV